MNTFIERTFTAEVLSMRKLWKWRKPTRAQSASSSQLTVLHRISNKTTLQHTSNAIIAFQNLMCHLLCPRLREVDLSTCTAGLSGTQKKYEEGLINQFPRCKILRIPIADSHVRPSKGKCRRRHYFTHSH